MRTMRGPLASSQGWHTRDMTWLGPDDVEWTPASRRLIPVRLIALSIFFGPIALAGVVLAVLLSPWWWIAAGSAVALACWSAWIGVRLVGAHGWAERDDDLLIKRGRLSRTVTVVPYGRMQYVEVSAGPLLRAFGLASVELHTASSGTNATLSGVPADLAAELRDRLSARGEARMAGL